MRRVFFSVLALVLSSCHGQGYYPAADGRKVSETGAPAGQTDGGSDSGGPPSGPCNDLETRCQGMSLYACVMGGWMGTECNSFCQKAGTKALKCDLDTASGKNICVCENSGQPRKVGEPCSSPSECESGDCDVWCRKACTSSADCGVNSFNLANYCAKDDNQCHPPCPSPSACMLFSGTSCQSKQTMEGTSANVCSK